LFPAKCSVLVTTNQIIRGGKTIELKKTVDNAVQKCPSIKNVFVMSRTGIEAKLGKLDINLEKVSRKVTLS
jgi:acetyl-CoA synthetase